MQSLSEHQLLAALLAVAVILVVGRGAAELARRLGQPEVLGELLGGVLLGPSVFGALFPSLNQGLFLDKAVSQGLSLLSWVGAILVLLIAGIEVDLRILRQNARPGILAAAFAIVPSIVAGTLFAWFVLGRTPPDGIFLGLVLTVTAVSVAAKILIERDTLRRGYAQVILAAGVASEVVVWLLISVVSSLKNGDAFVSGARAAVVVVVFFALMMTLGRRFTYWAMRRTADLSFIVNGELSLVLVLTFISAAITQALDLHALLGAFVFGVLLSQAPRATQELKTRIQTLTVSLFAPIFFVLAGMRVDIFKLGSLWALVAVIALFLLATAVKVGLGALGARLGGLRAFESLLVGIGINLKGGTDVVVAILGAQLGLLSVRGYTLYAVVAILTVLVSPPIISLLERRVPPSHGELERLNREEARRRAYLPHLERVLVPSVPALHSDVAAGVVEQIARVKHQEFEVFDITELTVGSKGDRVTGPVGAVVNAGNQLREAGESQTVEVMRRQTAARDPVAEILQAAADHDIIAIGADSPSPRVDAFSLGPLQDRIIDQAQSDVLVVVGQGERIAAANIRRILVPVNGFAHSLAAGDVAAYLARAYDAELVLFTSTRPHLDSLFWRDRGHKRLLESGYHLLRELSFRVGRLNVYNNQRVVICDDPGSAILSELERQPYDLIVLGAVDRSTDNRVYLGTHVEVVLTRAAVPAVVLVSHP